jgi:hypothetical protein
LCNISSFWKSKGPRNQFSSYREIFRVSVFRAILDRLIYNDEYQNIDSNLTDSNVGARKFRNIRDNIFVLNAIMNSQKNTIEEALDMHVYDVEQCFDSLWLEEVINCLYQAGLQNDKLPLLFLENRSAQVAVKTPGGLSKRKTIRNIIMQGSVWGSLCCVVLMDKLGKIAYSNPNLLYYYKGIVACPPLQMVDDVLGIQKCGPKSLQLNTTVNTFMELEKLKLSKSKCHKVHVGKFNKNCPDMKVHGEPMSESKSEKYLGDIIHSSGTPKPNIARRLSRGWGKVNEILAILKEAPLGRWRVKAGLQLRQAMLINGTLFNSEAWHGITLPQIKAFEKVDEALLRGILASHSKGPVPALYMEVAQLPVRFILASRRILYLHNILHRNEKELIKKVYNAQKADPSKGDYCKLVESDMNMIDLKLTDQEITNISRFEFKTVVRRRTREAAIKYLEEIKETKSKMDGIIYTGSFDLQPYLQSSLFTQEESSLLLALRTRTVRGVRSDFGEMYPDRNCPLPGCTEPDSLPHILVCSALSPVQGENCTVQYSDVFSNSEQLQWAATSLYIQLLAERERLLEPREPDLTS